MDLGGRLVIEHSVCSLLAHPRIAGVQLAVDLVTWHATSPWHTEPSRVRVCGGGAERMDSVLAGLRALPATCLIDDFVLVHDAARPLLARAELDRLFAALDGGAAGALLALPVADSLKRAEQHNQVAASVDRADLWRALTPQAFRRGPLTAALQEMVATQRRVTDECAAMSEHGVVATLVPGDPCNFKITNSADLELARTILAGRGKD
jgi:2-C-methyl-D-erythritol 4-phosphate cytidylyltransferase